MDGEDRRIALGGLRDALVMMVDDDPLVVELTQAFLQRAGYRRFVSTSDASAAIAMLLRELPDVVLLDLNMPHVSGFDVLGKMRGDPVLKHIPAIVLTSADDAETRLQALDLGAADFLRKPVDPSELALRLRNTLAARAHREALRKAFVRYVSPRLADGIINDEAEPFASPAKRAEMVALFADLRGFTRLTESVGVEHVVSMLNEYFTVLTEATYNHEGTIFNMAGDSLLVGFNVPFEQPDAATRAWRTAVDMLWRFSAVAAGWREKHGVATGMGIGISQGPVIIGNVGSPHYMSYTVIGNTVNIAARLKELALVGEVLVTSQFYGEIRRLVSETTVESRGEIKLRGKAETVKVYSIRP